MAQTGDVIHEDMRSTHRVNVGAHTEECAHTQVKPQNPMGLLSAPHTRRLLISGCWLTPFNRIPPVLGFLLSVEDAHATSTGRVGGEQDEHKIKAGLWPQWQ